MNSLLQKNDEIKKNYDILKMESKDKFDKKENEYQNIINSNSMLKNECEVLKKNIFEMKNQNMKLIAQINQTNSKI